MFNVYCMLLMLMLLFEKKTKEVDSGDRTIMQEDTYDHCGNKQLS